MYLVLAKKTTIKNYAHALEVVKDLKQFSTENGDLDSFALLKRLEMHFETLKIRTANLRQSTMVEFFKY